ncbi:MAG: sodium:solute symporter, partial [Ignavibacteriae bacterium]|nr:sodium:solute symporter [Ignavibacteriota bacterium]
NDIYLKYIKPNASQKTIKTSNYIIGITVVIISIILGIQAKNVNQVLQLLVSALWGGYTAANVLKWYWWRFNAQGYFWGMFSGIIISAIPMVFPETLANLFPDFAPDIRILYYFPIILFGSLIGCLIATYLTKPTDIKVLKEFYKNVRPWGFWKPIQLQVLKEFPELKKNDNFFRDMLNIVIGTLWQTSLVALPMYIIFHEFTAGAVTFIIAVTLTLILKKTWYDRLNEYDN